MASDESALNTLRCLGWLVAIHNDYLLSGKRTTFWLFTHPTGRFVKGEAETDAEACRIALDAATIGTPCDDGIARVVAMLRNPPEDLLLAIEIGGLGADPADGEDRAELSAIASYIEQHAHTAPSDDPTREELIEALADALAPGTTRTLQEHFDARDRARSVLSRARRG